MARQGTIGSTNNTPVHNIVYQNEITLAKHDDFSSTPSRALTVRFYGAEGPFNGALRDSANFVPAQQQLIDPLSRPVQHPVIATFSNRGVKRLPASTQILGSQAWQKMLFLCHISAPRWVSKGSCALLSSINRIAMCDVNA